MPGDELLVRILGDDSSLQRAFTRSSRRAKQFEKDVASVNTKTSALGQSARGALSVTGGAGGFLFGSGAFVASALLTAGIAKSVDAASDLNEQISKSRQVFGEASREVEEWSQTTATALGISQREAIAATGTFGNLFKVIDLAPETAADMSRALVQLAADLASFNNASPEDVLIAIRSGLIGEAEPLRRYGVLLSEARVQQLALANSGKSTVKALTDQEKALARYQIILQDTATAQGDFARTSDGLANQTRILRANLDDLAASIGGAVVDDFGRAAKGANTLIGAFQDLGDAIGGIGGGDFSEANASFDELVRRAEDFASVDFTAPQLEALVPRIVAIGEEFNRLGRGDDVIAAFREASAAIDTALTDGVITPLEKAQLEADALGRIFLQIAPEGVLQGLAADVRSGIEDATATARVGVEDLGAEIRSGIEDASRQAAIAARAGGEGVGDSFVEGLQASSSRIEGQLASLSEQVIRAQIRGDEQAELVALQEQQRRLRVLLRKQEQIVETGGAGAATARERIRKKLLPQLLAVSNAIDRVFEDREKAMQETERNAEEQKRKQRERTRKILEDQREQRELERLARRGGQFEALGLTESGDERVPGAGALRRRLRSLREQVKGTTLDTQQTQQQLDRIKRVLSGKFGEVGRDVRSAILAMFNEIASALEQGDAKVGPLTRTSGLNTKKIVAGLGLSESEINALRGRLSGFNTAGRALSGGTGRGADPLASFGGAQGAILVESHTTINLDGQQVAKVVTKQQQKGKRRNPQQKRGPNRNR